MNREHPGGEVERKVAALARRSPAYADLAAWLGGLILTGQEAWRRAGTPRLDVARAARRLAEGRPALDPSILALDWRTAREAARAIAAEAAREDRQGPAPDLEPVLERIGEDRPGPLRAVLTGDTAALVEAAAGCGLEPPALGLLLLMALRPALRSLAVQAAPMLPEEWARPACPVCGGEPLLASLSGESGERRLHCGLCETAWPAPRLGCVFCGCQDRERLGYLAAEDEPGLRVDLCDACGRHLKVMDLRELDEPVLVPLDELATWHLDQAAARHRQGAAH